MKEVWRVSVGNDPQVKVLAVLYANGVVINHPQKLVGCFDWSLQDLWDDIVAYKTDRAKEGKYKQVCCDLPEEIKTLIRDIVKYFSDSDFDKDDARHYTLWELSEEECVDINNTEVIDFLEECLKEIYS